MHERGWKVEWWGEGRPAFFGPSGQIHFEGRWEPPRLPEEPVEALLAENRARGAEPDEWTAGARWCSEQDVPDDVWFAATEAALPGA